MMEQKTLCGLCNCGSCNWKDKCAGCLETGGSPFGGSCVAARQIRQGGMEAFQQLKKALIGEFNGLNLPGLQVDNLHLLNGFYVNLEYPLPNGSTVQLLEDKNIYLGNQVDMPGSHRCYGIIADETHLLVCQYSGGGADPEIVLYKKR